MRLWHLSCHTLLVALFAVPLASASDDVAKPYKLQIVLDIARNKVLTEVFRQQIERELGDGIQAAVGDLVRVAVTTQHPKLEEVQRVGLRALDAWKEISDTKTHFVRIDLVDNQYEIRARQYDGPTGTASPVLRVERTSDRAFVARTAALLIKLDFGFTGSFANWPTTKQQPWEIQLALQGAGLGQPLSRFVRVGDVFSVVQMFSDGRPPRPVEGALLQVKVAPGDEPAASTCTARLFSRYADQGDKERNGHAGYRCVKLGGANVPVRLRLFQTNAKKSAEPLRSAVTVEVRRNGFTGEDNTVVRGSPDSSGTFTSLRGATPTFDRAAFVSILSGGRPIAFVPLALVDDSAVKLAIDVKNRASDGSTRRALAWQERVDEAWQVHVKIFQDLRKLADANDGPREKVVELAEAGRKRAQEDSERLRAEREELLREPGIKADDLHAAEQTLADLDKGARELDGYVERIKKIDAEENSPERKSALNQVEDARLAEKNADYGKAIELYEKAAPVYAEDKKLQDHLADLKKRWEPKSDAHRQARQFIYETWPGLDKAGLERDMEAARNALKECEKVGDTMGPAKLILATKAHSEKLARELKGLNPAINIDEEKPAELIRKVSAQLLTLTQETLNVLQKLDKAAPAKKPATDDGKGK